MEFGRYRVIRGLGDGAMGSVFLAADELLGREVAIKSLRPVPMGAFQAEVFRQRFANEARAVAALSHPSIVRVFDMGFEGTVPYLVMEVVHGPSLKAKLAERGPLAPEEARALGVQMARALDDAHARGILHRDVKPANILEAEPGVWKLADFGVARVPDSELTLTGQFLGSPAYGAPEAFRGEFTPASDVYGLAATLREAVTGQAQVPADLEAAIARGLAADPSARPSARRLAEMLAGTTAPSSTRPMRIAIAVGAAALLVGLVVGVALSSRGGGSPALTPPAPSPFAAEEAPAFEEGTVYPQPRSEWHAKQWRKVQEKLQKGDYHDVQKRLEEILEAYPDDAEAKTVLERIRRQDED